MGKSLRFLEDRRQLPQTMTEIQELPRIIKKIIDEIMSRAWGWSKAEERIWAHEYGRGRVLARLYMKYKRLERGYDDDKNDDDNGNEE